MSGAPTRTMWTGRAVPRFEDERFTSGSAKYVDDLAMPGALHAAFVRSPVAHALLRGVRLDAARSAPGVRLVLGAPDIADDIGSFPINPLEAEVVDLPHPVLAHDRVRYAGEPVAVVVAETAEAAVDAGDLVELDFEELPAVIDLEAALQGGAVLHEEAPDNVLMRWHRAEGDVDAAFARAAHVVRERIRIPRLVAAPLEPRGALASYDRAQDLLTIWVSAQDQHRQLTGLSSVLRREPTRLRIVVPDVGGAFGSKGVPGPETALVGLCAIRLDRPVKWTETRTENVLAAYQGRGADVDAALALDRDGRMLAVRARYLADLGAYLYTTTPVPALTAAKLLTGCYSIPAAEVEVLGLATTKVPTGPYRGAGRPEAALVLERLVDIAAHELKVDPVELRRRNLIARDDFPHATPLGFVYDSGDYEGALDAALKLGRVEEVRAEQAEARESRSEEHTSELQSRFDLVCRLLLEKKKNRKPRSVRPILFSARILRPRLFSEFTPVVFVIGFSVSPLRCALFDTYSVAFLPR